MLIDMEEKIVDVLKRLQAQAAARRMALDAYLEQFVETDHIGALREPISLEEFDLVLDELGGAATNAPTLPADFSRADIYVDHD